MPSMEGDKRDSAGIKCVLLEVAIDKNGLKCDYLFGKTQLCDVFY
jgi:hypothetical protein